MQSVEQSATKNGPLGAGRPKKRFVPPRLVCYGELGRITMQSPGGNRGSVLIQGRLSGSSADSNPWD